MKVKNIIVWVVFLILSIYVLPVEYYTSFVYGLLICLTVVKLISIFGKYFKTLKGTFCEGTLVAVKKETPNGNDQDGETYSIIDIEFVSPIDNKKYIITNKQKVDNPKTKFKIWINPDNPSKSLVVNDLDIHTVLWMGVAVVIFVVLLLRELKNI